jgi:hypothetical protein
MFHIFRLMVIATSLTACVSSTTPTESTPKPDLTNCPKDRPQICTRDYQPVCAVQNTGVRCVTTPCPSTAQKTYSNACSACADPRVIGHAPDACPASTTRQ